MNLSKNIFEKLSKHISDFEQHQDSILGNNSLVPVLERKKYQDIFAQYNEQLQHLLNNAQINDSNDNSLPFVMIGSVVELENQQNKRINKILITFPSANPAKPGKISQTSYNSPIGQALFLKKPGDSVEVNAPGGLFLYRIKSVILPIP